MEAFIIKNERKKPMKNQRKLYFKEKYEGDKKRYLQQIRRAKTALEKFSQDDYPELYKRICVKSGRRDRLDLLLNEMLRCRAFMYFENQLFFSCTLARMSEWGSSVQTWMDTLSDLAY